MKYITRSNILTLSVSAFILYACSPFAEKPFLMTGAFSGLQKSTSDKLFDKKDDYNSVLPIHIAKESKDKLSINAFTHLKKALDKSWKNAEITSEKSFAKFLKKNEGKIELYRAELELTDISTENITLNQNLDETGSYLMPASKNVVVSNSYSFKVNFKWRFKTKQQNGVYITPLKDELVLVNFKSISGKRFTSGDLAAYVLNYSDAFSSEKWKSALAESLSSSTFTASEASVIAGESSYWRKSVNQGLVQNIIKSEVYEPICKLFYFETGKKSEIEGCEFKAADDGDFEELAAMDDFGKKKTSFLKAAERELKSLKISSCFEDTKKEVEGKTFYDLYVKVKVSDKAVLSLMKKGAGISLYQKKGNKRAYKVSRKNAIVESVVDSSFCGKDLEGETCIKAKYWLKSKSKARGKCKSMLSGKYIFSIKKDNIILI